MNQGYLSAQIMGYIENSFEPNQTNLTKNETVSFVLWKCMITTDIVASFTANILNSNNHLHPRTVSQYSLNVFLLCIRQYAFIVIMNNANYQLFAHTKLTIHTVLHTQAYKYSANVFRLKLTNRNTLIV